MLLRGTGQVHAPTHASILARTLARKPSPSSSSCKQGRHQAEFQRYCRALCTCQPVHLPPTSGPPPSAPPPFCAHLDIGVAKQHPLGGLGQPPLHMHVGMHHHFIHEWRLWRAAPLLRHAHSCQPPLNLPCPPPSTPESWCAAAPSSGSPGLAHASAARHRRGERWVQRGRRRRPAGSPPMFDIGNAFLTNQPFQ